jgi:hypothetical protein
MRKRSRLLLLIAAWAPLASLGFGSETTEQVVRRVIENERQFLTRMQSARPIVETYIQQMNDRLEPVRDDYLLTRLGAGPGAGKDVNKEVVTESRGFRPPFLIPARFLRRLTFMPAGWQRMIYIDTDGFDEDHYKFEYVRRDFLGDVRCLVFNVSPTNPKAQGRFIGSIWVEDRDYHVVRFNGRYTGGSSARRYFHFDSWRTNVEPGFWAPANVYVEEGVEPPERKPRVRLKAQVRLWDYAAADNRLGERSEITVDSRDALDEAIAKESGPWASQRMWEHEAEQNVLDKLERSGLLAPKGEVDKVLDTVVNNLEVTNRLNVNAHCRVMLTSPLETFSIGKTIVISRGLIDVLPDEASLAMALAGELAEIALVGQTPTAFAFGDRTLFDDRQIFKRLNMRRTEAERAETSKKALEYLRNSPYKDKLAGAGLFLRAVESEQDALPNLLHANIGSQFTSPENLAQLAALRDAAPPLEPKKLDQIAALPLGARVKLNIWTDQIALAPSEQAVFTSERDKMPFEVTPMMLHLARLDTEKTSSAADRTQ